MLIKCYLFHIYFPIIRYWRNFMNQAKKPTQSKKTKKRLMKKTKEIGGREGLDPTRYGDWEKNGRCIDF